MTAADRNTAADAALIAAPPTLITDLLAERDAAQLALGRMDAVLADHISDVVDARAERDAAVARADRLDAAIRHHQSEGGGNMSADWDLWAAADREDTRD